VQAAVIQEKHKITMENTPCHEGYTYPQFMMYLYLCAAYSDFKINTDEVDMIREKMKRYNIISPEDFDKHWHKVVHDFRSHSDFESIQHIEDCFSSLNMDEKARLKIYNDFKDILMADGREDQSEKMGLFRFKKILGLQGVDLD
jgi:uncharacterized tellurite resistance protein B-like protein